MDRDRQIDIALSTLNAMDIGTIESLREKLKQVKEALVLLDQTDLAARAAEVETALVRGDLAEFRRGRAFLQAKIGHLR